MSLDDEEITDSILGKVYAKNDVKQFIKELKKRVDLPTITKVDFDSAVKEEPTIQESMERMSGAVLKETQNGERSLNGQEQRVIPIMKPVTGQCGTMRDKSIIAQCLVKAVIGQPNVKGVDLSIKHAVDMYKKALELIG